MLAFLQLPTYACTVPTYMIMASGSIRGRGAFLLLVGNAF